MIKQLIRMAVFGMMISLPALASAQGAPPPPPPGDGQEFAKVHQACRPDIERLCKDIKPGGGRIRECLKAHAPELSDVCKGAIQEAREHHHPKG